MVAVMTRAFDDSTVKQRLANFSGIPTRIVEHVAGNHLHETYACARVGMTTVTCFTARFNAAGELLNVSAISNSDDAAVGADASYSETAITTLLDAAKAQGAKGWYLEAEGGTCLYIHEPEQDIIIACN